MVLDEIVHNSIVSINLGRGSIDGKVSAIGTLANNVWPTVDKEGMDMSIKTVLPANDMRTCERMPWYFVGWPS